MIGKLRGIVDEVGEGHLIIDVNGVGYIIQTSSRTMAELPAVGEPLTMMIETQVREDAITLFGFMVAGERDWFRTLLSVQGVGAKVALSILTVLRVDELALAVSAKDKAAVSRANGVGPKLALRIVNELADKAPVAAFHAAAVPKTAGSSGSSAIADAVSALTNLGYSASEASRAVSAVHGEAGDQVEALIAAALKELAQ